MKRAALICLLAMAGCEAGQSGGEARLALGSETLPKTRGDGDTSGAAVGARTDRSLAQTSFAALIQQGVTTGPLSKAAGSAILDASAQIEIEKSALRPQISAEGSVISSGTSVPVLRLNQIIYDGGRTEARVALRQTEAERVYQSEVASLSARTFQAVETVIDFERDKALLSQAKQNAAQIEGLVVLIEQRFDAGAGSIADVLSAKGRLSNAQSDVAQAITNLASSKAVWVEVFGGPPKQSLSIPTAPQLRLTDEGFALQNSPRLRELALVLETREQELGLSARARVPTVSAILETDFNQGTFSNGVQARLGVNFPIYRGGLENASEASAKARRDQALAAFDSLKRELTRSLSQARAETDSIQTRLSATKRAVALNEQALVTSKGQFELGKGNFTQIVDPVRELDVAQERYIRQKSEARRAEYAILAVTGDILDALGILAPLRPVGLDDSKEQG
ncbi:Outer membrane protein TolC [Lentibacter algarum]|uniref:Outer membrane protein TolC n=1 Tax=Lentibacter algarum TaxID=576131 RepID=A0A1H3IB75_9RHOB|nr:TolC family protein [Lentibacter algarum]SDY24499.1 Outer membrane protein TolC [Lentibacter algarum]